MRRSRFSLAALVLTATLGRGAPLEAQRNPTLDVVLPAPSLLDREGPLVQARDMLNGARIREPLAAGFPARFHFRVDLYTEGLLNQLERTVEYDMLVRRIALENVYEVLLLIDRPFSLGKFAKIEDAEAAVARRTRVPITALRTKRKMYYKVTLEVQVIESSDLDEVDRWLRGNIESPLKGRTNPGTALTRGLRSIAAKLLGGESRQYDVTSPSFKLP